VKAYFAQHEKVLDVGYESWGRTFEAWKAANPKLAEELGSSRAYAHTVAEDTARRTPDAAALLAAIPEFPATSAIATRKAAQDPSRSPRRFRCSSCSADLYDRR
jgi:transketolase